jgi:hypothetical protein
MYLIVDDVAAEIKIHERGQMCDDFRLCNMITMMMVMLMMMFMAIKLVIMISVTITEN